MPHRSGCHHHRHHIQPTAPDVAALQHWVQQGVQLLLHILNQQGPVNGVGYVCVGL